MIMMIDATGEGITPYQESQRTSGWLQDMQVRYRSHLHTDRRINQHNVYRQLCSCETFHSSMVIKESIIDD